MANHSLNAYEILRLKALPQWVCWRFSQGEGKRKKPPCSLGGELINPTDPANWIDFAEAAAAIEEAELLAEEEGEDGAISGIGFSLSDSDPFTCIDIDHCLDENGAPDDFAKGIIRRFNSYTEVSPSGNGLHIWVKGNWPASPRPKICGREIEIYSCKRYMTVTGIIYQGTEIEARQEALDALLKEVDVGRVSHPSVDNNPSTGAVYVNNNGAPDWRTIQLDPRPLVMPKDADLIERIKASRVQSSPP